MGSVRTIGGYPAKHIMASIDASLDPAGTDHVDMYQIPLVELRDTDRGDHAGLARGGAGRQGAPPRVCAETIP